MLYTKCKNIICVGAIWALSPLVYAVTRAPTGFGAVANNMIERSMSCQILWQRRRLS